MATIFLAVRAARLQAHRVASLAMGMTAVLDMGTQLAAYRRQLVHRILAIRSRGLEEDWAAIERDAARVEWPRNIDPTRRGEPARSG